MRKTIQMDVEGGGRLLSLRRRPAVVLAVAAAVCLGMLSAQAAEEKKAAPAAHPAPAPHAAAPAAHPAAPPAGGHPAGGAAPHPSTAPGAHPSTSAPHPTTAGPAGAAGGHPTTAGPGGAAAGAHPTTSAGGAAAGAHPSTAGGGAAVGGHPSAAGGAAGAAAGAHPSSAAAGHPAGAAPGHAAAGAPTHTAFTSHPAPAGSHEVHTANGAVVRTRADGSRSDVHDARRGMDIHRGLDGSRHAMVERADHSRVFAERGGHGYVQHPYMFHGHEFGHRTYWEHGHAYDRYYMRYGYHGVFYDVYAPMRFYPIGFYGWAYNPWLAPVPYAWGWGGNPWYGAYGWYFTPYPVYPSAAYWMADYMFAASLQAAYEAQAANAAAVAAAERPAPLSPQVKDMVAEEVRRQMDLDRAAAQANATGAEPDPAAGSVAGLLMDGRPHTFVAASGVDVVDSTGRECLLSNGDVLQVSAPPPPDSPTATASVLAAKGGVECFPGATVSIAMVDLQGMQNHMRETIGLGMAELQAKQGTGGLPAAPPEAQGAVVQAAFSVGAPPPDANAAAEIGEQAAAADQAEKEVASAAVVPDAAGAGAPPPTITLGQSIGQVTAALGQPKSIVDLGMKKIYVYPDMKIYFQGDRVADIK